MADFNFNTEYICACKSAPLAITHNSPTQNNCFIQYQNKGVELECPTFFKVFFERAVEKGNLCPVAPFKIIASFQEPNKIKYKTFDPIFKALFNGTSYSNILINEKTKDSYYKVRGGLILNSKLNPLICPFHKYILNNKGELIRTHLEIRISPVVFDAENEPINKRIIKNIKHLWDYKITIEPIDIKFSYTHFKSAMCKNIENIDNTINSMLRTNLDKVDLILENRYNMK